MQSIKIELLSNNTKTNKVLIDFIDNSLKLIIHSNHKLEFEFMAPDKTTEYPRAIVGNDTFVGVSDIRNVLNRVMRSTPVNIDRRENFTLDLDSLKNDIVNKKDEDDNDLLGEQIDDNVLNSKMEKFKSKKVKPSSKASVDISPQADNTKKSSAKIQTERMHDDDIGGTFAAMSKDPSNAEMLKDDAMMENIFANLQESKI